MLRALIESSNRPVQSVPSPSPIIEKPKRKYTKRKKEIFPNEPLKPKRNYIKRKMKKYFLKMTAAIRRITIFCLFYSTRSEDECGEERKNFQRPAPSDNEYFSQSHPRLSHVASTSSSESRRKSTPSRIVPVPTSQRDEQEFAVRVKGVIRDPSSNAKCLYLLVESSAGLS